MARAPVVGQRPLYHGIVRRAHQHISLARTEKRINGSACLRRNAVVGGDRENGDMGSEIRRRGAHPA